MNGNQSARNDWPMVPIFGRRKRPRQAFHVEPSQGLDNNNIKQNTSHATNTFATQNAPMDDSFDLLDVDNDDLAISIPETSNNRQFYERQPLRPVQMTKTEQYPSRPTNSNRIYKQNTKSNEKGNKNVVPELMKMAKKERNPEQKQEGGRDENLMNPMKMTKSQTRREPAVARMLTISTKDFKEVLACKDMMPALYELYGVLDSTVTTTIGQPAKRFAVKDDAGVIRCIFWEIDRPFPLLRRGTQIRCVGRITKEEFQCLSIRTTNQPEISFSKKLLTESQEVIKKHMATRREY